ncbi:hypothetical protein ACIHCM_34465 [Streptomyces sp. NPDC052023]|uniref:hypothetical protein n=1 Tax=Streptomyces sp. NPDC052023 TaxID=3365681 RepID=UPI0037D3EE3F
MNNDPLHAGVGDDAVFQQLMQRAFDEDMRQVRPPVDARATRSDLVMWCSSGSGKSVVYLLQAKWRAETELNRIRGELDRLKAMAVPEAVGESISPAHPFSAAKVASQLRRNLGLAVRVHALREQAAAIEALLELLRCALEQLLDGARYPRRERVVRTAASPCGVIRLTTPRVPRAPGPVRLLHRTEPTAGAAAA